MSGRGRGRKTPPKRSSPAKQPNNPIPSARKKNERGLQSTATAAGTDMQVDGQKIGAAKNKSGDEKLSKDEGKSRNNPQGGASSSQGWLEDETQLSELRSKLYRACKSYADGDIESPKTNLTKLAEYIEDTTKYADTIIQHLEMKSAVKVVKQKAQSQEVDKHKHWEQEAKKTVDKINAWLEKLKGQIENGKFDETAFKDKDTTKNTIDDKKTKAAINDIRMKLKNMQDDKDAQEKDCFAALDQLERDIKGEKAGDQSRKRRNDQRRDILTRIENCSVAVKDQKKEEAEKVRAIYEPLWEWRTQLPKEKIEKLKRKPKDMKKEMSTVALLEEVLVLQKEHSEIVNADSAMSNSPAKLKKVENQISSMWGKVMTASVPADMHTALERLEKQMVENKMELEKNTEVAEKVREIYEPLWEWRTQLPKEKTEMLKRKPRNIEKETNAVALLEEVSVLQKERFEIANADSAKSNSLVGLKNLENQISSMWGKVITDSVPADISTALEHLEKQMVENKTELEKLKETQQQLEDEIEHLKEDISRFDGSAEIKEDENACEVIKVVKQLRRNLNKKIKEENESQEQSTHKLQQCVNELWTSASCNMDDMASKDVCDDGRGPSTWQMLKEVTTAFKEFKDTSLEVEKVSFSIYKGLLDAESQVENSSESKTPTSVLKGALHRLQQSKTEMINFVKEFRELKLAMSLEQVDKASTENCKLITEKVKRLKEDNKFMESLLEESQEILTQTYSELIGEPYLFSEPNTNMKAIIGRYPEWLHGVVSVISNVRNCVAENKKSFEQRFVSVKKYESLKDKEKELNAEKEQLALRLSKVAGARLTDNNPNIADLSDPNRPTKIAEQYSELYDNEWTEAFEDIKSGNEPSKIYTLLQIIVGTYNMCDEISQNHQSVLKRVILRPAEGLEIKKDLKKGQKREEKKPESLQFSAVQSKTLSELRKQTAELSVEEVKKHIRESHEEWFKSKNLEKYTAMCIELCWLMHVQSPPVFMETNVKPGSSFDTNRYKEYTKKGKKTDFLVWPALFLHEGGSVLAKGVAQGK